MTDTPKDIARLMKRCQIGVGGRNAIDDAHDIMAECYGTLGKLSADLAERTRERDEAYERGLEEGRIDLTKIVRKWDSECLDPPEVEGLRDYAMLDGERLETLWKAFELALAREMQTANERDALRAEVERLRSVLKRTVDLAEFWITREDTRGLSESEYKTWHALGYGSNAMKDARAALTPAEVKHDD